jgi:hypothetical protein
MMAIDTDVPLRQFDGAIAMRVGSLRWTSAIKRTIGRLTAPGRGRCTCRKDYAYRSLGSRRMSVFMSRAAQLNGRSGCYLRGSGRKRNGASGGNQGELQTFIHCHPRSDLPRQCNRATSNPQTRGKDGNHPQWPGYGAPARPTYVGARPGRGSEQGSALRRFYFRAGSRGRRRLRTRPGSSDRQRFLGSRDAVLAPQGDWLD